MADLLQGGQPGGGRAQNGGRTGPVPVSGTHPPSGVRTPTDVMRARRDRERRKAEQEALAKQREEEEELRQLQEAQAADPGNVVGQGRTRQSQYSQARTQAAGPSTRRQQENVPTSAQTTSHQRGGSTGQPQATTSQQPRTSARYEQPSVEEEATESRRTRAPRPNKPPAPAATATAPPSAPAEPSGQSQQGQRSGFPHAFERWETLSSHWEGLTSYWIRRLQENSNELQGSPLSQQMSRQITDLSAAGANLFHAVVELQRLRASSERKFQRWFFETRAEQERSKEAYSQLQQQLQDERQQRTEASGSITSARAERIKAEELVKEMKRELQISKEEARRAWEELGRREQEERDRTTSLRNGEPTLVGGVQVVPMMQGGASRQTSTTQRPSEGSYQGGPVGQSPGQPQSRRQDPVEEPEERAYYEQPSVSSGEASPEASAAPEVPYYRSQQASSRAGSVPSSSRSYGQSATRTEGRIYPQSSADTAIHESTTNGQSMTTPARAGAPEGRGYVPSGGSSDVYAEEEYAIDPDGNYRRDSQGRPILYRAPHSDEGSDEYEGEQIQQGEEYQQEYGTPSSSRPTTSATARPTTASYDPTAPTTTSESSAPDYSGRGWGGPSTTGWESITPRHRHPTRLSDVLEEDERSRRTSPSRGSLVSGGDRGGGR